MIFTIKPQMARNMAEEIPAAIWKHLSFRAALQNVQTSEHGVVQTADLCVVQINGRELRNNQKTAMLHFIQGFCAGRGWEGVL